MMTYHSIRRHDRPNSAARTRWRTLDALLIGLALLLIPAHLYAAPPAPETTLTFAWDAPPHHAAPGWLQATAPGHATLPYTTTLIVLPPTGAFTLTTRGLTTSTRYLRAPLALTPPADPPALWSPPLPAPGVTLTELGRLRGARLTRLTFAPLDYDPTTGRLTQIHTAEAVVQLAAPLQAASADLPADPLLAALEPLVANPAALRTYAAPALPPASLAPATLLLPQAQLRLRERGLYALPWDALQAADIVTATTDPARVQAHRLSTGAEIALQWDAAGQRFLFYADPQATRWADHEVYRFGLGTTPGLRMETQDAPPPQPSGTAWATVFRAEQRHYDSRRPSPRDGDPWYWACLERPAGSQCPATAAFTLTLDAPDTAGPDAALTLWLRGYTSAAPNPDHHVTAQLNAAPLGDLLWDGPRAVSTTFSVPASALRAGSNTLTLTLPGLDGVPVEGVWLDAVALRYPLAGVAGDVGIFSGEAAPRSYPLAGLADGALVYDITAADAPIRRPAQGPITDAAPGPRTYLALDPASIRAAPPLEPLAPLAEPGGADYLVLAPQALIPALEPLLDLHRARGLTPFVAPTEAVYDQHGDGRMSPEALRAFVAHAYAAWNPRPAYLLLVGDGTWDPLDHLGTGTPTLLPPYLAFADPWLGEIPADHYYALVDGDDLLPDLAVGRLPVNDNAELEAVVAKLVTYATAPLPGDWNTRHVFVADDPDPAGDFPAEAEKITAHVPLTHTVTRLYCADNPDNVYVCENLSEVRAGLLRAWDAGALVINWVGHSAYQQWEHGRLFHTDDLPALRRAPRYPLVLSLSCFTGNFAHPEPLQTGMDEALLRLPGAGAIGTFGSSGQGVGSDHTPLHRAFYQATFGAAPAPPGVAATLAKTAIIGSRGEYLAESYHYLGDPALPLHWEHRPWAAHVYLPVIFAQYP